MHAKPECFIPVYEPTRTQQVNASDRFASHDARRRRELVPRQIERITGEDVPIVHVPPEASVQDDPAHEASAAEILDALSYAVSGMGGGLRPRCVWPLIAGMTAAGCETCSGRAARGSPPGVDAPFVGPPSMSPNGPTDFHFCGSPAGQRSGARFLINKNSRVRIARQRVGGLEYAGHHQRADLEVNGIGVGRGCDPIPAGSRATGKTGSVRGVGTGMAGTL